MFWMIFEILFMVWVLLAITYTASYAEFLSVLAEDLVDAIDGFLPFVPRNNLQLAPLHRSSNHFCQWSLFYLRICIDEAHLHRRICIDEARERPGKWVALFTFLQRWTVICFLHVTSLALLYVLQDLVSNFCFASPSLDRTRVSVAKVLSETLLLNTFWDVFGLPWNTHILSTTSTTKSSSDCAVCFEPRQIGTESCVACKHCGYTFHKHCIERWVQRKPNCPCCRSGYETGPFYLELR